MTLTASRKRISGQIYSIGAALTLSAALLLAPAPAKAQKVYVGSANGWDAMIAHPEQWSFVRKHADDFYVNFIPTPASFCLFLFLSTKILQKMLTSA